MPVYDYKYLLTDNGIVTTDIVSTNTVNFGVAKPNVNKGGKFGLHIIITTAFTGAASGMDFSIVHSASDNLSTSSTKHTTARIQVSDCTAGAHIFIPMASHTMLQYVGAVAAHVSEALTAGYVTMYLGDAEPPL